MADSSSTTPSRVIGIQQQNLEYVRRSAVRLVLFNKKNEVAIMWSERGKYFKLPGGGVEENEDHMIAAEREAMEETGCRVRIAKGCFATCEEWRNNLHQLSYCYRAQLEEDTGDVQLTEDEVQDGLENQWCEASSALQKLKNATPITELGQFIQERDAFFLETAIKGRS